MPIHHGEFVIGGRSYMLPRLVYAKSLTTDALEGKNICLRISDAITFSVIIITFLYVLCAIIIFFL